MKSEKFDYINKLFWETLSKISPLQSPQINTFGMDKYSRPPSYSFRFESKSDLIYNKIAHVIDSFRGNLVWKMYAKGSRKNFTIEPELVFFAREQVAKGDFENIKEAMSSDYYRICDLAILDIPILCDKISDLKN